MAALVGSGRDRIVAGVCEALAGVPASLIGVTIGGIGVLNYVVAAIWRR